MTIVVTSGMHATGKKHNMVLLFPDTYLLNIHRLVLHEWIFLTEMKSKIKCYFIKRGSKALGILQNLDFRFFSFLVKKS